MGLWIPQQTIAVVNPLGDNISSSFLVRVCWASISSWKVLLYPFLFFHWIKQSYPNKHLFLLEVWHEFQRCSFLNSCCKVGPAVVCQLHFGTWQWHCWHQVLPLPEHIKTTATSSTLLCLDLWGCWTHLGLSSSMHTKCFPKDVAQPAHWMCSICDSVPPSPISTQSIPLPLEKTSWGTLFFYFHSVPYYFNSSFSRDIEQTSGW